MSKLFFAAALAVTGIAASSVVSPSAEAGMYMPPPAPVAKPKPVATPPRVVAPPNVWGGRPGHGYYRPPVVVRPPSTKPHDSVTVITKPRR
jgi:hypothetical protein